MISVSGAEYICTLPTGYSGPDLELIVANGLLMAIHPEHKPIVIDMESRTTRQLVP